MVGARDSLVDAPDDIRLLTREVATVSETLREIATTWRPGASLRHRRPPLNRTRSGR